MTISDRPAVHTQQWFLNASDAYADAMVVFRDEQDQVADARMAVYDARERVKDLEAEMLVNGGAGKYTVGTGDAKRREAVIRLALREDNDYQTASKALQRLERALDRAEANRDNAANQMSLQKRRIDAYLAAASQQAAILTVRGADRSSSQRH